LCALVNAFPKGSRVQGTDSRGEQRTGIALGVDHGVVSNPHHANYGRTYTGVWWLDANGERAMGGRERPFTDELTVI
jgi:hypothetical protein